MPLSPPSRLPPKGWRVFNGALVPDDSVGGFMVRGQEVTGTCHMRDCRRRFNLDYEKFLKAGLEGLPMRRVKAMLACHHPAGCALEVREGREGSGVRLSVLAVTKGVRVKIRCALCGGEKLTSPAKVIAGLQAAGAGGGDTLHSEIAGKLTKPCGKCHQARWLCEVRWPESAPDWTRPGRLNSDGIAR
jgi:hypothetical protein